MNPFNRNNLATSTGDLQSEPLLPSSFSNPKTFALRGEPLNQRPTLSQHSAFQKKSGNTYATGGEKKTGGGGDQGQTNGPPGEPGSTHPPAPLSPGSRPPNRAARRLQPLLTAHQLHGVVHLQVLSRPSRPRRPRRPPNTTPRARKEVSRGETGVGTSWWPNFRLEIDGYQLLSSRRKLKIRN